jgi:hypothetical protein
MNHITHSKLKISYTTLSGYTIAKNCCDLDDVNFGLNELYLFVRQNYPAYCKLAHTRIFALEKKKLKFINK